MSRPNVIKQRPSLLLRFLRCRYAAVFHAAAAAAAATINARPLRRHFFALMPTFDFSDICRPRHVIYLRRHTLLRDAIILTRAAVDAATLLLIAIIYAIYDAPCCCCRSLPLR